MVEAPERIWLIETDKYNPYRVSCSTAPHSPDESTEYLRADIAERQIADLRAERDDLLVDFRRLNKRALAGSGAGGWRDAATELPPIEQVVLTRRASAYDGADIYAFGARVDSGEGWCWGEQSGYGGGIRPDRDAAWNSVEVDDEYLVTHWMPLPAAPTATGGR